MWKTRAVAALVVASGALGTLDTLVLTPPAAAAADDVKSVLELHPINGQDYYLGIFLIGAYQEILGDLHNLFGNTNTVHVSLAAGGGCRGNGDALGGRLCAFVGDVDFRRRIAADDHFIAREKEAMTLRLAPDDDEAGFLLLRSLDLQSQGLPVALEGGGSLQCLGVVEVVVVGWIGKRGHVLV